MAELQSILDLLDGVTPEGRRIMNAYDELSKVEVDAGFIDGKGDSGEGYEEEKDGASILDIAAYNEFGTKHIPPRPFMHQTFDEHKTEIENKCAAQARTIMAGATAGQVAVRCGLIMQSAIRKQIRDGTFEPDAKSTLRAKAPKTKPLIDTGRMRQDVNFKVKGV